LVLGKPAAWPDGFAVTQTSATATATSAGAERRNIRDIYGSWWLKM
jgi:hypothetical protein